MEIASMILARYLTFVALFSLTTSILCAAEPKIELLWPDGAPGAKGEADNDKPKLNIYLPEQQTSQAAVIVFPGGGYGNLAMDHEGKQVAEWLNTLGLVAFVLDYRHGGKGYAHPAPLEDAQRAIRTVRSKAAELKIDPKKVGIMGFSAGGHLASTAGTHFNAGKADATDPIDRESCRPDFLILCYPAVSLSDPYAHKGSRKNLLGEKPDPEMVKNLSNETQVTGETPPTFLFHTGADKTVAAENSILFYMALRKAKVPAELHIYQDGKHGVGLAPKDPLLSTWKDRLKDWLQVRGLLNGAK
jgi:acetyl esterase/lipase